MVFERDLNLEATELRLALPGTEEKQTPAGARSNKRALPDMNEKESGSKDNSSNMLYMKAQVVGWPPVRSYHKNCLQTKKMEAHEAAGIYVKVSMDGAPYLRKIDMKMYKGYSELLKVLEDMFKFNIGEYSEREGYNNTNGSEYVATYEDKDGDWMLVGDVPWDMFVTSCKRLRIMKGSEAKGLGCVV